MTLLSSVYRPGKNNQVADFLSRVRQPDGGEEAQGETDNDDDDHEEVLVATIKKVVTQEELEEESANYEVMKDVAKYVQEGWSAKVANEFLQPYYNVRDELSLWGRNFGCLARGHRAVIPSSLRYRVLETAHVGHIGMTRMKQRCSDSVWWPGLDRQVENLVRDCEQYAFSGKSVCLKTARLQPIQWPSRQWEKIQIDIFGEVQAAPYHQRFMIVVYGLHSKWP